MGFILIWCILFFVSIQRNINLFLHATFHITILPTFDYEGLAVVQYCNPELKLRFLQAFFNFSEIIIGFSEGIYHHYNFNPQTRGCFQQ